MSFTPRSSTTNQQSGQQQYQRDPSEPPLLRLGGLYTSQSGKAIMGNVFVSAPRRPREGETGTDIPFGEILIDMIRQCMEESRPLRFLVFEAKGGKAPYSLNVTLGGIRTPAQQDQRKDAPRVAQQANQGGPWIPQVPLPDEEEGEDKEPEPEPIPRPVRRIAPRR